MFRNIEETYQVMEQLANFAAKRYFQLSFFPFTTIIFRNRLLSEKGAFREEDFFPTVTKYV